MAKINGMPTSIRAGIPKLPDTPVGWKREKLNKHLFEIKRPVNLEPEKSYRLVTVKRSRGGVEERSCLFGREIKTPSQFLIETGDFLISKRQIVHGACGIVPVDLAGSVVSNEYAVIGTKGGIDLSFLQYLSESMYFQQTCFHSSIGVHVEKMIFNVNRWLNWDFNIPPIAEQTKIVEILAAQDQAIEKLNKLIENSKEQKKSLMQQLVTGKKRFSGFKTKWKKYKLSQLSITFSGGTPSRNCRHYFGGGIPWVKSGEINNRIINSTKESISESGLANSSAKKVPAQSVLIAMYGATAGKIAITTIEAAINQAILAVIPNKNINHLYLFYALELELEKTVGLVQGGQPNLNAGIIKNAEISVPEPAEQEAIANCLINADATINNLNEQMNRLQLVKQALMQQLFTGKHRINKIEKLTDSELAKVQL
ncbi:MAG: hypothetical protein A2076_13855 [Geobacteraceae bacterium GWC2_53_11]|nr:MAG: hypothetical protein A2076_13855 [Geobacteraceae bacterium GWC2_53_11]